MVEKRLFKLKKKILKLSFKKYITMLEWLGVVFFFFLIANSDLGMIERVGVAWVFGKKLGGECWAP